MGKGIMMTTPLRFIRNAFIGFIAIFIVIFCAAQIPFVKTTIVQSLAQHYLKQHNIGAYITNVRGVFPFTLRIKNIRLTDHAKTDLAHIDGLHITFSAHALLQWAPKIKHFSIERLHIHRALPAVKTESASLASLATVLPFILEQSILTHAAIGHITIESEKTKKPTNLTFHYQKDGIRSHIELTSIEKTDKTPPVNGQFMIVPDGKGIIATLKITDKSGALADIPIEATGEIRIDDLRTCLPIGTCDVAINEQHITADVKKTHDQKTQLTITHTNHNHDKAQFSAIVDLHGLVTSQRSVLSAISVAAKDVTIRGDAILSIFPKSIQLHYNNMTCGKTNTSPITTKGMAEFHFATNRLHVKGEMAAESPIYYEGNLIDIAGDARLIDALIKTHVPIINEKDVSTFILNSPNGIRLNENSTFTLQCHEAPILNALTGRIHFGTSLSDFAVTLSSNEAPITGDIHIKEYNNSIRLTGTLNAVLNRIINGKAAITFDIDTSLTGKVTSQIETATIGDIPIGKTIITLDLTKGDGIVTFRTGEEKISLLKPYGMAKGHVSVVKQMLQIESLSLIYHQQQFDLKNPVNLDVKTKQIPSVNVSVGKGGLASYNAKTKRLHLEKIPLSILRLCNAAFDLDGAIDGHVDLTNDMTDCKGKLFVHQLIARAPNPLSKNPMLNGFSWVFLFEKKAAHLLIDTFTSYKEKTLFKAKGSLSLDRQDFTQNILTCSLVGEIDVEPIIAIMSGSDRIAGKINTDLRLSGPLNNIQMTGMLHVKDGLYESGDNGTYIADINGHLKATGKRLAIEQLSGNDGRAKQAGKTQDAQSGNVDITGYFELGGAKYIQSNIILKLTDLVVTRRDDMVMRATGDIHMAGPGVHSKITGSVTLSPSVILLEELSSDTDEPPLAISELTEKYAKKKAEESQNHLFPIELTLIADKNFYIRGFGLDSQWAGQMVVKGDLSNPYLIGALTITKGKLAFFGKQLTINEAKIWYDEADKNNPNLLLVGVRKVDDILLRLHITGRASSTVFSYSSTPAMPEDEILARLLFGKELNKISAGQSVQLAAAATSINGGSGLNLLEGVRHSFGFDTFELKESDSKASLSDSGQTNAQSLRIGKEFENVKIFIDQNIGNAGSKATVSTAIAENLYVDIDVGQKNTGSGVGLSYVIRY